MREIKFRFVFKHQQSGELEFRYYPLGFLVSMILTGKPDDMLIKPDYVLIARDQCAGLKDKNDKEIYENDFVSFDVGAGRENEKPQPYQRGVVTCSNLGQLSFGCWLSEYCSNTELISSIHENPELIKEAIHA